MKKYKLKTRRSAKRRFKITATGKVLRRHQNMRHLRANKSAKTKRTYRRMVEVKGKFAKKIRRMVGLA
jgi:large subunit ribosomal protein L35